MGAGRAVVVDSGGVVCVCVQRQLFFIIFRPSFFLSLHVLLLLLLLLHCMFHYSSRFVPAEAIASRKRVAVSRASSNEHVFWLKPTAFFIFGRHTDLESYIPKGELSSSGE